MYYASASGFNFTSQNFTVECWVKFTSLSVNTAFVGQGQWAASGWYVIALPHGSIGLAMNTSGNDHSLISSLGIVSTGTWYHLAFVRTGISTGVIYLNGASQGISANGLANGSPDTTDPFGIGTGYGNGTAAITNGVVDEVRISSGVRSADWILTEYRNQSAHGTYISSGPKIAGIRVRHAVIGGI